MPLSAGASHTDSPRWSDGPDCVAEDVGPGRFQPSDGSPAITISDWARLRCAVYGGNVYEDGVQTLRTYPSLSWEDDESHRRGRPPKWLVSQRRASGQTDDG
jgi:hypothetical protein